MAELQPIRIGVPYSFGVRIRLSDGVYVNPSTPGVELRCSLENKDKVIVADFTVGAVSASQFGLSLTAAQTAALAVGMLEGDILCYRDGYLHWEQEFNVPVRRKITPSWT